MPQTSASRLASPFDVPIAPRRDTRERDADRLASRVMSHRIAKPANGERAEPSFGRGFADTRVQSAGAGGKTSVLKNFQRYDDDSRFLAKADELDHVVRPMTGAKNRDAPRPMGFYHRRTDSIHLPPNANVGHAMHEALHRYSSPVVQTLYGVFLNEGFTQFFTDRVLDEQQVEGKTAHNYQRQLACARKVIGWATPEMVARAYFQGEASPLSVVLVQHTGVAAIDLHPLARSEGGLALCEKIEQAKP